MKPKTILTLFAITFTAIGNAQTNTFPSSGNAGIGTTNPNAELEIRAINDNANLHINAIGNGVFPLLRFQKDSVSKWGIIGEYPNDGTLSFYNNTAPGHIMVLKSDGNVGIGTDSPTQKLQIHNPVAFNSNMESQAQDHILFSSISPGNGGFYGGLTWKSGSRRRASIAASQEHSDGDHIGLAFFTQGVDGPGPMYESMRIRHNGNVGIGTSDPGSFKLAVNGKIRAKEVIVDTGWSDFVFEVGYDLRSLNEVESHIKEHGHLPGVPSAAVVESEGLSVGEAQKIMMQKIEELTLYMIDLKKENEALKTEVEKLKSN